MFDQEGLVVTILVLGIALYTTYAHRQSPVASVYNNLNAPMPPRETVYTKYAKQFWKFDSSYQQPFSN
jgi:hypothetical protein